MGKGARLRAVEQTSVSPAVGTSNRIEIPADKYWELRCRAAEHAALPMRLQAQLAESQANLDALLTAAGLDPRKGYNLDDATLSATAVAPDHG